MKPPKFNAALDLVSRLHAKQYRKGTKIPYLSHLMAVCSLVLEASEYTKFTAKREELAIAALLHDALEDQGHQISLGTIKRQFGPTVAQIVSDCSDDVITVKGQKKAPWRTRKEKYIAHIGKTRKETQLVSCADKLHNLRSILWDYRRIGDVVWDRFTSDKAGTLWYYRSLAKEFLKAWPENPLASELDLTVRVFESEDTLFAGGERTKRVRGSRKGK
jgi:(p)ppGpp synthase/HD superfamily hydrolase